MNPIVIEERFNADTQKIIANDTLLSLRKWVVIRCVFPDFTITMVHPKSHKVYAFNFCCDDYPISMQIVDRSNFSLLPFSDWPQGNYFLSSHTATQRPFLCIPGIREYHTHSSHDKEQFDLTSDLFRLPRIIDAVYARFNDTNS